MDDMGRALVIKAAALIDEVINDAESQHPGGWGPDVTTVVLLKEAHDLLHDALDE